MQLQTKQCVRSTKLRWHYLPVRSNVDVKNLSRIEDKTCHDRYNDPALEEGKSCQRCHAVEQFQKRYPKKTRQKKTKIQNRPRPAVLAGFAVLPTRVCILFAPWRRARGTLLVPSVCCGTASVLEPSSAQASILSWPPQSARWRDVPRKLPHGHAPSCPLFSSGEQPQPGHCRHATAIHLAGPGLGWQHEPIRENSNPRRPRWATRPRLRSCVPGIQSRSRASRLTVRAATSLPARGSPGRGRRPPAPNYEQA